MQVLVNFTGTQWDPVKDVKLSGITYTAAAYTYMNPHGVPSAGDWALERYVRAYAMRRESESERWRAVCPRWNCAHAYRCMRGCPSYPSALARLGSP